MILHDRRIYPPDAFIVPLEALDFDSHKPVSATSRETANVTRRPRGQRPPSKAAVTLFAVRREEPNRGHKVSSSARKIRRTLRFFRRALKVQAAHASQDGDVARSMILGVTIVVRWKYGLCELKRNGGGVLSGDRNLNFCCEEFLAFGDRHRIGSGV